MAGSKPHNTPVETAVNSVKPSALHRSERPRAEECGMHPDAPGCGCPPPPGPAPAPRRTSRAPRSPSASAAAVYGAPLPTLRAPPSPYAAPPSAPVADSKGSRTQSASHSDRARQHQQSGTHSPAQVQFQRGQTWLDTVTLRMLALDPLCQQPELRIRAVHRGAWLEPADHRRRISLRVGLSGQRKRNEEIDRTARRKNTREIEGRGQDPHHHDRRAVEREFSAHHARIGSKAPLPEAITQQSGRRNLDSPLALLGSERSADCRLNAKQRKEIPRNGNGGEAFRFAGPGQFAVAHAIGRVPTREIGERLAPVPQIQKMAHLDSPLRAAQAAVRNPDETPRIAERQWTQQQSVHHAEYG